MRTTTSSNEMEILAIFYTFSRVFYGFLGLSPVFWGFHRFSGVDRRFLLVSIRFKSFLFFAFLKFPGGFLHICRLFALLSRFSHGSSQGLAPAQKAKETL